MRAKWIAAALLAGAVVGCADKVTNVAVRPPAPTSSALSVSAAAPWKSAQATAPPPTWSAIYATYLGAGSSGACGRSAACHVDQMRDAAAAYEWLANRGYIDGTRSALVSHGNSCLRWFGGNMPPHLLSSSDEAERDLEAWVAAGAPND